MASRANDRLTRSTKSEHVRERHYNGLAFKCDKDEGARLTRLPTGARGVNVDRLMVFLNLLWNALRAYSLLARRGLTLRVDLNGFTLLNDEMVLALGACRVYVFGNDGGLSFVGGLPFFRGGEFRSATRRENGVPRHLYARCRQSFHFCNNVRLTLRDLARLRVCNTCLLNDRQGVVGVCFFFVLVFLVYVDL